MIRLELDLTDERFWNSVDRNSSNECWEWLGYRMSNNYGLVSRRRVSHSPMLAHRYSWLLTHGALPLDLFVCHRCDNPPCVNPSHLFLGTPADNNNDKLAKGRGTPPPNPRGLAHHAAFIPDEQVHEARESYAAGREFQYEIAARLGVAQATVYSWLHGKTRIEAGGPIHDRGVA